MTGSMWGADVEQLRQLGQAMVQASGELEAIARQLTGQIGRTHWEGADGDHFRSEWKSRSVPTLAAVSGALVSAGKRLVGNAGQQDQASVHVEQTIGTAGGAGAIGSPAMTLVGQSTDDRPPMPPGPVGAMLAGALGAVAGAVDRLIHGPDGGPRTDEADPAPSRRGRHDTDPDGSTPGTPGHPGGLGAPVAGESVTKPEAPPWSPPDVGAGEHGSEWAGPDDYALKAAVWAGAQAAEGSWPHASDALKHYLDNSGTPFEHNVDQLLNDVPAVREVMDAQQHDLGLQAVDLARQSGATGPVTFPVSTDWQPIYVGPGLSQDWFYASGGMALSQQGEVTVYPPSTPGGEWRYEVDTTVSYRDQYNWDTGKQAEIGPLTVTDHTMGQLHRAGIAQEFTMYGESSNRHVTGTVS